MLPKQGLKILYRGARTLQHSIFTINYCLRVRFCQSTSKRKNIGASHANFTTMGSFGLDKDQTRVDVRVSRLAVLILNALISLSLPQKDSHKHFSREGREICNLLPQKPRKAIVVHSTPSQRQRVSDTAISPVSLFSVNDSESSGVQTSIFSGLTQPPPSSMSSLTSSVESNGIARLPWNRNGNYELPSSNGVQANLHSQSATIISSGSLDIEKVLSPISFHEELEPRTIEEMLDDTHEDEICDFC